MLEPNVIYEDRDLLVVNKPSGLQVHAARVSGMPRGPHATLVDWLVKRYPEIAAVGDDPMLRPGIVHRLDKETSGVMLVARNQKCFEYLKQLFQKHEIRKTYLALVFGEPKRKRGVISAPIGIRSGTMKRSVRSSKMAKPAVTEYRVVKTASMKTVPTEASTEQRFSLLEVWPATGRTHQIRVHLASIGHAVVGDRLYGPKKQPAWVKRLMLHALSLEFTALDGRRLKFEADPPSYPHSFSLPFRGMVQ